jgi:hypothetical protein
MERIIAYFLKGQDTTDYIERLRTSGFRVIDVHGDGRDYMIHSLNKQLRGEFSWMGEINGTDVHIAQKRKNMTRTERKEISRLVRLSDAFKSE